MAPRFTDHNQRIKRLRLKHELFDKRYEIFTAAMRSENVTKQSEIEKWFNVQLNALAQQFQSFIKLEH